jgi:hypothetical protein
VPHEVPVLGLATVAGKEGGRGGRIALYGDSNCLDSAYRRASCESFAISVVRYLAEGDDSMLAGMQLQEAAFGGLDDLPKRVEKVDYATISRVLQEPLMCRSNSWSVVVADDGEGEGDGGDGAVKVEPVPVDEVRVDDDDDAYGVVDDDGDDDDDDDDVASSSLSQPPPEDEQVLDTESPPAPHVNADDVFDTELTTGGNTDPKYPTTDLVTKEFMLAAVAFLLLFLLGCARWRRGRATRRRERERENGGGRRPGSAAERLPILTEGAPRSW